MLKKVCLVFLLFFSTFLFSASEFDKDIVVKNQSRNDKVKTVFREMMDAYEEENIKQFFLYVSEDRFEQDYMTFYEAIDEDMRVYDILNIDTWVNKITDDGVKRFLYVQWDKRYLATSNDTEINQKGYSRFLFDEINGKYKLIQLAGNNFWGGSLPEWTEEVSEIAGQVSRADLVVQNVTCNIEDGTQIEFELVDQGEAKVTGDIEYKITDNENGGNVLDGVVSYLGIVTLDNVIAINCEEDYDITVMVDPQNTIVESDETNNEAQATGYNEPKRADLVVENLTCNIENGTQIEFELVNQGEAEVTGDIEYKITDNENGGNVLDGMVSDLGIVTLDNVTAINCDEDYDITVMVDPQNTIVESDETNNEEQATGYNEPKRADLVVQNLTCNIENGTQIEFELVNQGEAKVTGDIEYKITDNENGGNVLDGMVSDLGIVTLDNVTAINCDEDYDITVMVDPQNTIVESDETNNEAQETGNNPVDKPDLVVDNVRCTAQDRLYFDILNEGVGEVLGDIEYSISDDSGTLINGTASGTGEVYRNVSNAIDCSGEYEITVAVDPENKIAEEDDANNETVGSGDNTPAPSKPDLIITNAECFYNSPDMALRVTIKNQDAGNSGSFQIKNLDTGRSHSYTSGLNSGESDTIEITADTSCSNGNTIKIDSADEIDESNENNNNETTTGTI